MISRTVSPSEQGKRLHRYLCSWLPNYPLGQIYKMIDQGKVRVNGKRKKKNYELASGDELTLHMDEDAFRQAAQGGKTVKFAGVDARIEAVYEDRELLVVNKPAGLLTHPDRSEQKTTLITQVHAYLHKKGELDSRLFLPAPANRLDRNTSGLVLIGKTAGMLHQLNRWIQSRDTEKYYVTIVEGTVTGESEITGAVVRDEARNRTVVVAGDGRGEAGGEEGKEAVTRYRALTSAGGYTLVEVELVSGRTHQIRTHFQSIGHSLLGDVKYGGRAVAGMNHQLLHAWKIVLPDGRRFTAAPPAPFQAMMDRLGLRWEGDGR